jgi:hypothetical protein
VGPGKEVSAVVHSDAPVVAERTLRFLYRGAWDGISTALGSTAPMTTFYFAEGYTGANFDEYLTMANFDVQSAACDITYLFADGSTQVQRVSLLPRSRGTVDVKGAVGGGKEVAVKLTCSRPIAAERPMYFAYDGVWTGGHIAGGLQAPSYHLYFAEGYTGPGFVQYLTILNPGPTSARLSVAFLLDDGSTVTYQSTVPAHARSTIKANDIVPGRAVSTDLSSDQPIVAERLMYFSYNGTITGGHDVVGSSAPSRYWLFPDLVTTSGTDSYLTVGNPQDHTVTFTVAFFDETGSTLIRNYSVPARARQTLAVAREAGSGRLLSAQLSASDAVVAEAPLYSADGINGGADVMGWPLT